MDSQSSSLRRAAAGLLVLLTVAGASPVAAKMFATAGAIPDFVFVGGDVYYDTPSVGEMALVISSENAVELTVSGANDSTGVFHPWSGFTAKLNLNAKLDGDTSGFAGGSFMIFGSLPSAEDSNQAALMEGTLDAMQVDGEAGSLDFLFSGTRMGANGALAQQYRNVGIYAHVAGLDDIEWVGGYGARSIVNLSDPPTPAQGGSSPQAAIPVPGTALLILAGLFGLAYRQRRNCSTNPSLLQ